MEIARVHGCHRNKGSRRPTREGIDLYNYVGKKGVAPGSFYRKSTEFYHRGSFLGGENPKWSLASSFTNNGQRERSVRAFGKALGHRRLLSLFHIRFGKNKMKKPAKKDSRHLQCEKKGSIERPTTTRRRRDLFIQRKGKQIFYRHDRSNKDS